MWVVPDDNYVQKKGVKDRAGFYWWVDNNCLKNQQLKPLQSLVQQTELLILTDDNYVQKKRVEDRTGLRAIITVSKIRN